MGESGRLFQARGPAMAKVRSPIVRCVAGTKVVWL